jgi:hypothetical protein
MENHKSGNWIRKRFPKERVMRFMKWSEWIIIIVGSVLALSSDFFLGNHSISGMCALLLMVGFYPIVRMDFNSREERLAYLEDRVFDLTEQVNKPGLRMPNTQDLAETRITER